MDAPVLICGATGTIGGTGGVASKVLLEKGFRVRAFVHKSDERSSQLESQGAEIFVGDLLDLRDVRRAFEGVKRAYFVYPVAPGLVEATANFAMAALEAKAEFIVNMSQRPALPDAPSNAALNHWLSERIFDWAGIPVNHLQPTVFNDVTLLSRQSIKEGRFAAPFAPTSRFAPISAQDVGEVVAALIANPSDHTGQSYRLFGPVEMTPLEMTDIIHKTLGREMQYDNVSGTKWVKDAVGMDIPYLQQHFEGITQMSRDGHLAGTNNLVEEIIGRRPESVVEFFEKYRTAF